MFRLLANRTFRKLRIFVTRFLVRKVLRKYMLKVPAVNWVTLKIVFFIGVGLSFLYRKTRLFLFLSTEKINGLLIFLHVPAKIITKVVAILGKSKVFISTFLVNSLILNRIISSSLTLLNPFISPVLDTVYEWFSQAIEFFDFF